LTAIVGREIAHPTIFLRQKEPAAMAEWKCSYGRMATPLWRNGATEIVVPFFDIKTAIFGHGATALPFFLYLCIINAEIGYGLAIKGKRVPPCIALSLALSWHDITIKRN